MQLSVEVISLLILDTMLSTHGIGVHQDRCLDYESRCETADGLDDVNSIRNIEIRLEMNVGLLFPIRSNESVHFLAFDFVHLHPSFDQSFLGADVHVEDECVIVLDLLRR